MLFTTLFVPTPLIIQCTNDAESLDKGHRE